MALSSKEEADIINLLNSGKDVNMNVKTAYETFITNTGNQIVKEFKEFLGKNTSGGSNNLAQSIEPKPLKTGFEIEADFYYKFLDEGVKGAGKGISGLVTKGGYQFKTIRPNREMEESIAEWTGESIDSNYGVVVNIKKRGIKAKNITENVINTDLLDKISEDLAEVAGLMFEVTFDKALKQ